MMKISKKEQEQINNVVRRFGLINYGKHLNKVRIHGTESEQHFMAKSRLCYLLKKQKYNFLTEFPIEKNHIPDILVIRPLVALEILHTESKNSYERKVRTAPSGLIYVGIYSHDAIELGDIHELL